MNLRIVTDSTCDLPAETARLLDITVIPLNMSLKYFDMLFISSKFRV